MKKDPCIKFKKQPIWKNYYEPRIKVIERTIDNKKTKQIWKKLNTCSRMRLVDKFTQEGKFEYVIK